MKNTKTQYTAKDIKILKDDEIHDRFFWALAGKLADDYVMPLEFCLRLMEAIDRLRLTKKEVDIVIRKYIKREKIPIDQVPRWNELQEVYKSILKDTKNRR